LILIITTYTITPKRLIDEVALLKCPIKFAIKVIDLLSEKSFKLINCRINEVVNVKVSFTKIMIILNIFSSMDEMTLVELR